MKSLYGTTPWGSWFVDALAGYRKGSRLARGRTYANAGGVLSLELNAGRAFAEVEDDGGSFYLAEIRFPPLKEKEEVYRMIEEDPPLLARIAAGELPETFLQKLKKNGINLIPRRWSEMRRSCTCEGGGDPCEHMAALYYIIAGEIDADPRALFRLRGMDLAARFGKSAARRIEPPFTVTFAAKEQEPAFLETSLSKTPAAGPASSARPPSTSASAARPRSPAARASAGAPTNVGRASGAKKAPRPAPADEVLEAIPHSAELISSLLPPEPPFCGRDFAAATAEFYRRCADSQSWEAAETEGRTEREHAFSRSAWTILCPRPAPGAEPALEARDVNGNKSRLSLYDAFEQFAGFSSEDGTASYSFLFYLFKFLNLVCSSCAFVPYTLIEKETLRIIWRPFETVPPVPQTLAALASRECGLLQIGGRTVSGKSAVDLLASAFLNEWVRRRFAAFSGGASSRGALAPGGAARQRGDGEYRQLLHLFFNGTDIDISMPARRSLPSAIDRWLSVLRIDFAAYRYSIAIKDRQAPENKPAAFDFTLSMDAFSEKDGKPVKTPLLKCKDPEALRAPIALSHYLPELRELISKSEAARLSEARLVSFLDSAAPLLARLGVEVILPKALHRELKPRLAVKGKSSGSPLVHYLDLESLQDFEWQVAIGEELMSPKEFEQILKQKQALIRFRDGFVKLDPEAFARLLKKAKEKAPDLNDILKAHFSGETALAFDAREAIEKLFREQEFPVPKNLAAELRPYQKRGYNWICSLLYSGFGCILADDMGLGKTVQSIAALLRLKEEGRLSGGCVIVAPAALLDNWEKELELFAPSLSVSRYHGSGRLLDRGRDIFLTTYQTAARDAEELKKESFSMILVDEAHLMKNAEARISRAVKELRSQYRLALSGTPVQNRLDDLRSLFDFILPGYLGPPESFKKLYRVPIEAMRDRERAEALRKITAPFLLRRLKTDRKIIKDLPEKIVVNEYAALEKEQAALYESAVAESIRKSEKADPKDRISLILSLLTSLKQICDHPRVYDKESPAVSKLSGKAQLLLALLEEIMANREKALIFSQYVETLDCLEEIIKKELGEAPLVYHGGLSQRARSNLISRFQNDPAARLLLVSLQAGGLGLNLTAASRVIHYDLWYNPATENQATDRAFRIGQKRAVFVHRLIAKNSFEEKIDAMISSKQELADMTVAAGESWLARMSHAELKELFDR